ncbi:DUF7005 family protein [Aquimarina addita]
MIEEITKYAFLKEYTDNEAVISEVLTYTKNKFSSVNIGKLDAITDTDEPYIEAWNQYVDESKTIGVYETLKKYLVPFQFPIQKDISATDAYRDAMLRGVSTQKMESATGLQLEKPPAMQLKIYQSIAGKIPVLIIPDDTDFCAIIQAFFHKNEPIDTPESMGAALINGINNWDRIHSLKMQWQAVNPFGNWSEEFKKQIMPYPALYKDKIIVLSTKPYSNVSANSLGIAHNDWIDYSLQIRLAHECAHLFTLKQYGHMTTNMHDELIADYAGITKVLGRFNKKWFLCFMGLEDYPFYRKGGRLENYLGDKEMSTEAFDILKMLINNVADTLSKFDAFLGSIKTSNDRLNRIKSICELDIITMASPNGSLKLIEKYNNIRLQAVI